MRRREFVTLLGGAAAAWPLATRAQQRATPVIGFVRSSSLDDSSAHIVAGFRQGLKDSGFVEGENVAIEFHAAGGRRDQLAALIADLVHRQVAVIVGNSSAARAAKTATASIPVLFVFGGDPIKDGLVTSMNRPEGNVTGVTFMTAAITSKRLELLHQLVPRTEVLATLIDSNSPYLDTELRELDAARALGQKIVTVKAGSDDEIAAAFASFVEQRAGALLVGAGPFFTSRRDQIIALAARHRIPATYQQREYVVSGGLMSYGSSQADAYRQAGVYASRILKGEKPANLPVVQPTKFELLINLKTAKALGLTVPLTLQAVADEMID